MGMTFMLACVHVSMYVCGCTCSLESNTNVDRVSSLITLHFRYGEWTLGFGECLESYGLHTLPGSTWFISFDKCSLLLSLEPFNSWSSP